MSFPLASDLAAVLPPYVASRILLLAVSCAVALVRRESLFTLWNQWDSRWYLGIALHGYGWSLNGKPALAFFPLYPLLIHLGTSTSLPAILTALIISNVAFAIFLLYLYRLLVPRVGSQSTGIALWLVALFPMSFFTFVPYSEALFLAAASATLYQAGNGRPLRAGMWVAVALSTRSTGLILLPALLIFFTDDRRDDATSPRAARTSGVGVRLRAAVLFVSPPVVACVAYARYLQSRHIPLSRLASAERAWHRSLTGPWTGVTSSVQWLWAHGAQNGAWALENVLQLAITALLLGLTVAAWPRLDTLFRVYCASFWLLVLSSPEWLDGYYAPFSSMDRFILALFPLAGWAASRLQSPSFRRALVLSAVLMAAATSVHMSGGWVG